MVPAHVGAAAVGRNGERREDGGGEVDVAAFLADLGDRVEVIEPDSVEEEVCFEARPVAFVAQPHRFQVAILDQGPLVGAAVGAENVPAVPAVVLANHNGEVRVAALAPEHRLVLDPPGPLVALLRLTQTLERPLADAKHLHEGSIPTNTTDTGRIPEPAAHVRQSWHFGWGGDDPKEKARNLREERRDSCGHASLPRTSVICSCVRFWKARVCSGGARVWHSPLEDRWCDF